MKKISTTAMCAVLISLAGCASSPSRQSNTMADSATISENGPNVLNARSEPQVVTLNKDLQPVEPGEVIADVKDFKHQITDVRLKFRNLPIEVPMENIGGTTWKAELTPGQLQMLAVSGKTMKYDADVIATNIDGKTAQTKDPVIVAVAAPDLGHGIG
jgi:hypothetical protein